MRLLLSRGADYRWPEYRRFTRRVQLGAMFPDHLSRGRPYLAMNAVVMSHSESAELRRLTGTFVSALVKAGKAVSQDVPTLVDMGFPWSAAELLAAETPRVPLVGRLDFLQDQDGHWWLLEFNADTPSGIREATAVDEMVHQKLARDLVRSNATLAARLAGAFRQDAPAGCLGIVTDASEMEDLAQMAFTQRLLQEQGLETLLGDFDNLSARNGSVRLLGRPIAYLYRYVAFESMFGTPAFAAIYDGVLSGKLELLNGLFGLLLQHKGLLAWLWANRESKRFTQEEQAAIREHLPPTWRIDEVPVGQLRDGLVAKQVFGREGAEVFLGDRLDAEVWGALEQRRSYVAQRRVLSSAFDGVVPGLGRIELRKGHLTVGSFAVEGSWAGYYTRFGGLVTDETANWVATFEEPLCAQHTREQP